MTFAWRLYNRWTGVVCGGLFASEAEAQQACNEVNAQWVEDARRGRISPTYVARQAHLNGQYVVPCSPEQQAQWAQVEFSR